MKSVPLLRNAAQPFSIPLHNNQYELTRIVLNEVTDKGIQRKRDWFDPVLKFISFKNNLLTLSNTYKGNSFRLMIHIGPDELKVACSCSTQVKTICIHSYSVLENIATFCPSNYFEKYASGGLVQTALANKTAFQLTNDKNGLVVNPLYPHHAIYGLTKKMLINPYQHQLGVQRVDEEQCTSNVQPCYIILHFIHRTIPPLLLPCLGIPNKAGNGIRSFLPFLTAIQKENSNQFNETQQLLNSLCLQQLKEAETLYNNIQDHWNQSHDWLSYGTFFQLWQQVFPLLSMQPHVFLSSIYRIKDIKNKPMRNRTIPVSISQATPNPQFQLEQYKDHHRFEMKMKLNDRHIRPYSLSLPFIVTTGTTLHIFRSLPLARLAFELKQAGRFISIFKPQYQKFAEQFLRPLEKQLPVKRIKKSHVSKKQAVSTPKNGTTKTP